MFSFVGLIVALVLGVGIAAFFPPPDREFTAGIGPEWGNLPGNILGFVAGVFSFRTLVWGKKKEQ